MNKAKAKNLGYIGSIPSAAPRDSDSWFTPSIYLDAAREALGCRDFDFDPFSSAEANQMVRAKRYFTIADDAFTTEWPKCKNLWINPPYGQGVCGKAIQRICDQYKKGRFESAVVLVNNATDTKWFHQLASIASHMVFTDHRISFWNADGKHQSGNTRGQCFLVIGPQTVSQTRLTLGRYGLVVKL
jgi:phage N-6-adenine-methyltransferase